MWPRIEHRSGPGALWLGGEIQGWARDPPLSIRLIRHIWTVGCRPLVCVKRVPRGEPWVLQSAGACVSWVWEAVLQAWSQPACACQADTRVPMPHPPVLPHCV